MIELELSNSLDDKHSDDTSREGRHCRTNFADVRRMNEAISKAWGPTISFDYIIMDFFFQKD